MINFQSFDQWWWPYVFIAVGGWLATDLWRFFGVFLGGRIADDSDILVLVRCVATALVAAVVANLVVFPSGALAQTPLVLRIVSAAAGFASYLVAGHRMIVGILVGEAVLMAGLLIS